MWSQDSAMQKEPSQKRQSAFLLRVARSRHRSLRELIGKKYLGNVRCKFAPRRRSDERTTWVANRRGGVRALVSRKGLQDSINSARRTKLSASSVVAGPPDQKSERDD
jgi:hypothetical protein